MSANGAFTFVLHSHQPYVRLAGRWPHGEEWVHEAASETYIPLLQALYDLKDQNIAFRLTIGFTPILGEQLSDPNMMERLDHYLEEKIAAAKRDMIYFGPRITSIEGIEHATPPPANSQEDPHLYHLAEWHKQWYSAVKTAFNERFGRDIIGAFRRLQDEGYIEIMTSAATHAYLPLLSRDSSIRAQLKAAITSYERLFGRKPTTIWLPECGYRPAYRQENETVRVGLETLLTEHGFKLFFSETHAITGGQPVGVATGDLIGPYGDVKRRYVIPSTPAKYPKRPYSTFRPYYVRDTATDSDTSLAVIGRNNNTGQQVWSSEWGYPGDFDYREFYKKSGTSGLPYWRVTGAKVDLGHKDTYKPDWAAYKIDQHAEHFAHLVGDLLRDYHQQTNDYGLVASSYDTELFGHWWFEGVQWLSKVLHHLSNAPDVDLMTASDYVAKHHPQDGIQLPESSWGTGGEHFSWDNGDNHWMWEPLHAAEARLETLADRYPTADDTITTVLNQAARELMLMQSSDWFYLITTGQAREYAIQRFRQHQERFERLVASVEGGQPDMAYAQEIWEMDAIFPELDYRWYQSSPS